jgi:hypothetical protein
MPTKSNRKARVAKARVVKADTAAAVAPVAPLFSLADRLTQSARDAENSVRGAPAEFQTDLRIGFAFQWALGLVLEAMDDREPHASGASGVAMLVGMVAPIEKPVREKMQYRDVPASMVWFGPWSGPSVSHCLAAALFAIYREADASLNSAFPDAASRQAADEDCEAVRRMQRDAAGRLRALVRHHRYRDIEREGRELFLRWLAEYRAAVVSGAPRGLLTGELASKCGPASDDTVRNWAKRAGVELGNSQGEKGPISWPDCRRIVEWAAKEAKAKKHRQACASLLKTLP